MSGKPWKPDDPRLRRGKGCRYGHPPEQWNAKEALCRQCVNERKKATVRYQRQRVPEDLRELNKALYLLDSTLQKAEVRESIHGTGARHSGKGRKWKRIRRGTGRVPLVQQPSKDGSAVDLN